MAVLCYSSWLHSSRKYCCGCHLLSVRSPRSRTRLHMYAPEGRRSKPGMNPLIQSESAPCSQPELRSITRMKKQHRTPVFGKLAGAHTRSKHRMPPAKARSPGDCDLHVGRASRCHRLGPKPICHRELGREGPKLGSQFSVEVTTTAQLAFLQRGGSLEPVRTRPTFCERPLPM